MYLKLFSSQVLLSQSITIGMEELTHQLDSEVELGVQMLTTACLLANSRDGPLERLDGHHPEVLKDTVYMWMMSPFITMIVYVCPTSNTLYRHVCYPGL